MAPLALKLGLSFLLVGLSLPYFVSAEKFVLDVNSDVTKAWFEVSCVYSTDYNDLWVFGCPVSLAGDDDVFPQQKGFWSPCSAQQCEIQFYGGDRVPQAKSISFSMYLKGSPEVLITSKYSPLEEEFSNEVEKISGDKNGWIDVTIDLTDKSRALVLNFTMITPSESDVLLIDSITVDLGDDVTTPTEPPPPTTHIPIENDEVVTLDKSKDYWLLWDVECDYVENYQDFWVFGCPSKPKETPANTSAGYWSPCNSRPSCRMQYLGNANHSAIDLEVRALFINAYLDGDAKINITIQESPYDPDCDRCKIAEVISATEETEGKFKETLVYLQDVVTWRKNYINIDISGGNGQVLVDKIELVLFEPQTQPPVTTTEEPRTTTTPQSGSTTTSVDTDSTESTTASANKTEWSLFAIVASILFINFTFYLI